MNYIGTYQYDKINVIELKLPKYCIRVLYKRVIVRKNGISCEVSKCLFFSPFIKVSYTLPFISINMIHSAIHIYTDEIVAYRTLPVYNILIQNS
ncbi:hypothetical protein COL55_13750 [Bacillus toyonensis]|nr:hypothetical protein COL55_13750 [Bacillus toyonensis]PFY86111.1 hypothetical protein COL62_01880 [Bacillus toyonensis]PHA39995.1 hypothetical protein COE68_22915 [Bacillus toyonensis]